MYSYTFPNTSLSIILHSKTLFSGDDEECCIELSSHCYNLGSKTWPLLPCTWCQWGELWLCEGEKKLQISSVLLANNCARPSATQSNCNVKTRHLQIPLKRETDTCPLVRMQCGVANCAADLMHVPFGTSWRWGNSLSSLHPGRICFPRQLVLKKKCAKGAELMTHVITGWFFMCLSVDIFLFSKYTW